MHNIEPPNYKFHIKKLFCLFLPLVFDYFFNYKFLIINFFTQKVIHIKFSLLPFKNKLLK